MFDVKTPSIHTSIQMSVSIDTTCLFTELQNAISKQFFKLSKLQLTLIRVKQINRITEELFSLSVSLFLSCLSAERRNVSIERAPLLLGSSGMDKSASLTVADLIQTIKGKMSVKVIDS